MTNPGPARGEPGHVDSGVDSGVVSIVSTVRYGALGLDAVPAGDGGP